MNNFFKPSFVFILFAIEIFAQNSNELKIISKPISYNSERIKLSLEYLKERHNLVQKTPIIVPKFIILHYTAGGTLQSNFNYFNNETIESSREYNKNQSTLNVSAHYLIDRNGDIYNLIPDTLFARHTIGLNYCSIGIENIGSKSKPLTEAQVKSNAMLIRRLCKLYQIQFVIGHSEYGKFRKTKYWKETNPKYFTGKEDPGKEFLLKVRTQIKDLNLLSEP
jgi:N-acetyl-anhydromuramyl-L-alanine amidase AmpD